MRVIVTGATGFLGGALARRMLALGYDVIACGRDELKLARLSALGARTAAFDLATAASPAFAADAVVHCAALCAPWGPRAAFHRANVDGTQAALDLARAAGARRFVFISTPSVYFRFADQIGVREDAPLPPPVSAYARSKREAEALVLAATDLDPIILRPRGLYGAGDTTLLPRLIAAARTRALPLMRDGKAATDLTHVDDVVAAILAALNAQSVAQRIFNISGGAALNVRDVAERAAARAGVTVRWRKAPTQLVLSYARALEAASYIHPAHLEPAITAYGAALFAFTQTLDISAAQAQLGWAPAIAFDDGLARTFEHAA
jgi:nucleoside-diphosphate-sugar epimerase